MRTKTVIAIGALAAATALAPSLARADDDDLVAYDPQTGEAYTLEREDPHFTRFRFGISGVGGGHWEGGPDIGMGGAQVRVGVQLGDWVAIYYQPTGLVGAIYDRADGSEAAAGLMWNTAMIELTVMDFLQIGGGPSVDFIWGCDNRYQDEIDCDSSDAFFGASGRVALVLGDYGPGYRQGLTISAEVHPTWYREDDASIAVLGGIGYELY